MTDIKHKLLIKASPEKIYETVTTQEGLQSWWCRNAIAEATVGFVNIFVFGKFHNEMKVTELQAGKRVTWHCTASIDEWVGTTVSFDLEETNGNTTLRFTHGNWKAVTDTFASCNYDWAQFLKSLKSYCETGVGMPA